MLGIPEFRITPVFTENSYLCDVVNGKVNVLAEPCQVFKKQVNTEFADVSLSKFGDARLFHTERVG